MRYFLLFLSVSFLAFLSVSGGPAYSQWHNGYCEKAKSTSDTLKCVNRHHTDMQENLNNIYTSIADHQEEDMRALLSESQQNWVTYRDSQCKWDAELAVEPALKRVYELSCLTAMTKRRAELLENIEEREEKDAPREFGTQPRWINALANDYPDIYWRHSHWMSSDIDCDGENEQIMSGISVNQITDAIDVTEDGATEKNHHEVEVVVAVSKNPAAGRPKAELFRLPVTTSQDTPYMCRPSVKFSLLEGAPEGAEEAMEKSEGDEALEADSEGKADAGCHVALEITDKICPVVTLKWTGEKYELTQIQKGENGL